jgi:hypothetical protein
MFITKVRIDGQMFFLDPAEDVAALRERIEETARTQPTFVEFSTVGHGRVAVLVNSVVPVRFETVEKTDEQYTDMQIHPAPLDIDFPTDCDLDV